MEKNAKFSALCLLKTAPPSLNRVKKEHKNFRTLNGNQVALACGGTPRRVCEKDCCKNFLPDEIFFSPQQQACGFCTHCRQEQGSFFKKGGFVCQIGHGDGFCGERQLASPKRKH